MFCNYCGNKMDEDAKFCSKCGRVVTVATEDKEEPKTVVYENPAVEKEKGEKKNKMLFKAIFGLAFSVVGFTALLILAPIFLSLYSMEVSVVETSYWGSVAAFEYAMVGLISCVAVVPLSVIGVIFSIEASNLVQDYIAEYGETDGRATVAKSLVVPGKIIPFVTLGLTLLFVATFIVLMVV